MKLSHRILAAPLVAVAFLVATGVANDLSLRAVTRQFDTLSGTTLDAAHALGNVQTRMATMNALLYRSIALIDGEDAKSIAAVRQRITDETDALTRDIGRLSSQLDAEAGKPIAGVLAGVAKYRQNALQALTLAETTPGAATAVLASAERSFSASFSGLQTVAKSVDAQAAEMSQQVVAVTRRAEWATVALTIVAVLASIWLAWWSARRIVSRLQAAVTVSEAVARGELDVVVPPGENDELGRLLGSLRDTVQRLGQTLRVIHESAGSIQTASSEIAAGTQDLSSRTERSAGSLQQTAGSVQTLADNVGQSAAAARQAEDLSRSASDVAARGGQVVSQVVETMHDINASSKKIADIIGVIDGIAFQTNILALNAAVEAARAGEQGRGFAVVASEVRSLAQRSAEAAKEIKALIGASVDNVENGARLVGEAGSTMKDIVDAVRRVGLMVTDISVATGQQSSGLVEVNQAVSQLDHMTQQNAALVEQSAAASESLREQATRLSQVVGSFRLAAQG